MKRQDEGLGRAGKGVAGQGRAGQYSWTQHSDGSHVTTSANCGNNATKVSWETHTKLHKQGKATEGGGNGVGFSLGWGGWMGMDVRSLATERLEDGRRQSLGRQGSWNSSGSSGSSCSSCSSCSS